MALNGEAYLTIVPAAEDNGYDENEEHRDYEPSPPIIPPSPADMTAGEQLSSTVPLENDACNLFVNTLAARAQERAHWKCIELSVLHRVSIQRCSLSAT